MTLRLYWASAPHQSSHDLPSEGGCVPLQVTLVQKENAFPQAHVTLCPHLPLPEDKPWGWVILQGPQGEPQLLFQGQRQDVFAGNEGVCVELIARPPDAEAQWAKLLQAFQQGAVFDPLFLSPSHEQDPEMLGFFQPLVLDWDPQTLTVQSRHLLNPPSHPPRDLTSLMDPQTLKVGALLLPPRELRVTVCAQWVQRIAGFMNLSAAIAALFPNNCIQTYTPRSFREAWPRKGQVLGRSGYWVASSRLEPFPPPVSRSIEEPSWEQGGFHQGGAFFPKTHFRGTLVIGWSLQQKREEVLSFVLKSPAPLPPNSPPFETLCLNLQAFLKPNSPSLWAPHHTYVPEEVVETGGRAYRCLAPHTSGEDFEADLANWEIQDAPACLDPGMASFFLTKRGQKTAETALEIAHTHLIRRRHTQTLQVTLPLPPSPPLKLGSSVTLQDPRIPTQAWAGEVKALSTTWCGQTGQQLCQVTLRLKSPHPLLPSPGMPAVEDAASAAASETPRPSLCHTPSGWPYFSPSLSQGPVDGYAGHKGKPYTPSILHLSLHNGPTEQEAMMRQGGEGTARPRGTQSWGTRLQIRLEKIQAQETLKHTLHLTLPELSKD